MRRQGCAANLALLAATTVAPLVLQAQPPPSQRVAVVVHPKSLYQRAAASLTARLDELDIPYDVFRVAKPDGPEAERLFARLRAEPYAVIATSGPALTQRALRDVPDVPVVFFGVPNALDADFGAEQQRRRVSGVTTDVEPDVQVRWIRATYPGARRVAILHSDRSRQTVEALVRAGRRAGLTFVPIEARRDAFPAAIDALNRAGVDGVLMIPDAGVYNGVNVQRLLLWGARHNKPTWGFSLQVVKAGAFAGIFSRIEESGRQAADLIAHIRSGRPVSSPLVYPHAVGRAVNLATARTIGHPLDPEVADRDTIRFGVP